MPKALKLFSILILISLLFGTGCRTLKAPGTPHGIWLSSGDTRTKEAPIDSAWTAIRQRGIDTSKTLTLGDLIDIALQNNPNTQEAWQASRAAEAKMRQAKSKWYPKLTVSGTAAREKDILKQEDVTVKASPVKVIEIDDHFETGPAADLTYLLLDFGGREGEIEEAAQTLLSQNFQFNQAIQDLVLEVERAYYGLNSAYSAVDAASADVEDAKTNLESAEEKYRVGLVPKLDTYQAKANYDDTLYFLEEAKGNVKTEKGALAEALGVSADTPFKIAKPSKKLPKDIAKEDISRLIEESLIRRPDVRASRARLMAKEAAVKVANSALWPTLNAGATAEANWYDYYPDTTASVYLHNVRDQDYRGYFSVNWDVFDGFNNLNKKRAAIAELKAEQARLTEAEITASREVWTKYYAYRTAARKLTFSESFFESANVSYDLALESYKRGIKDILDLLDAQSKLKEARSKLIKSRKDLFVAIAELAHSTGSLYTREITTAGRR